MVNRVVVLGGGSAGFLAAITLKARLPDLEVTVLRSQDIGILGVGEGSTIGVPEHLHNYLGIGLKEFYQKAEPMWKLGIRFLAWGKRPHFDYTFSNQMDGHYLTLPKGTGFYCDEGTFDYVGVISGLMSHNNVFIRGPSGQPLIPPNVLAYHVENKKFVAFLESYAAGLGVLVRDDTVLEVLQDDHGITGLRLASGSTVTADLYVDSSGFAAVLLGGALKEPFVSYKATLFCDRAVVGPWQRTDEPIKPYTTAETMDAGWCFQIEHEHTVARGYIYSSAFISDAAAEAEYRAKNPRAVSTRIVKFISGRYERSWVKNVIAIGNASGFVEPMEATSLAAICLECTAAAETLHDCDRVLRPSLIREYNKKCARIWDRIRQFLAIHYKFNTRLDTPFWRECREHVDLAGAADIVAYYQENGPSVLWRSTLIEADDQFNMEGYLSLLVGQQVPYRQTYTPGAEALRTWQVIQESIRQKATQAFSVKEALQVVRSPNWQWPKDLYYVPLGALGINRPGQSLRNAP